MHLVPRQHQLADTRTPSAARLTRLTYVEPILAERLGAGMCDLTVHLFLVWLKSVTKTGLAQQSTAHSATTQPSRRCGLQCLAYHSTRAPVWLLRKILTIALT